MSQIIDASTRALQQTATSTLKALAQLTTTLEGQTADIQINANTIADQENLIAANNSRIESEVRAAAAEIRLQVKEDTESVLSDLLGERGLMSITLSELEEISLRAKEAEAGVDASIKAAVASAEQALHSRYKGEINALTANQKVELATLNAQAGSDASTISLLKGQIASLEATIAANREAEIKKAEAAANAQGVVVNAGR